MDSWEFIDCETNKEPVYIEMKDIHKLEIYPNCIKTIKDYNTQPTKYNTNIIERYFFYSIILLFLYIFSIKIFFNQ